MIAQALGTSELPVLIGIVVFVFGYMMFGGANAMVYTNTIQAVLMLIVALMAWQMLRSLVHQLGGEPQYAAEVVTQIAEGNLAVEVQTLPGDTTSILHAIRAMRDNLAHLVRQVRELITSARLTMDGRSLRQALADSVAEFSRRCIIVFELDNRLADDALNPETELQILQIIREALANAVRHSHARHVRIELRQSQDGETSVSVEDDGIGLRPASGEDNHFGLAIIRERAASIGARLSIEAIRPHGVRVHLGLRRHHDLPQGSLDGLHDLITDR